MLEAEKLALVRTNWIKAWKEYGVPIKGSFCAAESYDPNNLLKILLNRDPPFIAGTIECEVCNVGASAAPSYCPVDSEYTEGDPVEEIIQVVKCFTSKERSRPGGSVMEIKCAHLLPVVNKPWPKEIKALYEFLFLGGF